MRKTIILTRKDYEVLKKHLLQKVGEEAAFLICGISESATFINLLVREVIPVPTEGFQRKAYAGLTIDPEFMMPILKKCRHEKLSVILAHSHPFSETAVRFSSIDDMGERLLIPKVKQRIADRHHATLVLGRSSVDARIWKKGKNYGEPIDLIKIIGYQTEELYPTSAKGPLKAELKEIHNRQILALGEAGQRLVQRTKVGIVGLGGIGSQVFQQLVHLGVSKFVLVDPDFVEESNLSRIVGSKLKDAKERRPKVEVMRRLGKEINPDVQIALVRDSVYNLSAALKLRDVDVIFCCTDNLTSRMVLNRMAFQYLIPFIDMGVDIQCSEQGKIRTAGGRVMVILPDGPCLECLGLLNAETTQREIEQIESGKEIRYSYISGEVVHAPSVIAFNGVVASLAVSEFLNLLTGFEQQKELSTYQMFRILDGTVRSYELTPATPCNLCREVKALGDNINLPCRLDR